MSGFSQTTSLAHSTTNDTRFEELEKRTREYGRMQAQGKDSLPMFAADLVRNAADGLLDFEKDKHGEGIDDAKYLYGELIKSASKKSVHEHTDDGMKANVSKARALIKFGVLPHTTCDPVDVFNRAFTARGNMASVDPKSVKPAYPYYVEVARAQLESETALTDDQLKALAAKPDPKEKTLESVLTTMVKGLENLITGEKGLKCQDEAVIEAHDKLKGFVGTLMLTKDRIEKQAQLEKLQAELAEMNEAAEADASIEAEIAAEQQAA